MTIKVSNEGEKLLLEAAVGKVAAASLKLKLFTNNVTPGDADTVATYTEMGAVQGYAAKTLTTGGWNAGVAGTGTGSATANKASIDYPQQTWTFDGTGGSVTVYGYIITDNAGATLVCAEKFSAPQVIATAGDTIKITPKLTLGTE